MNPIVFPNYHNSILNVTASILKYYNVDTPSTTNELLDKTLSNGYRNIVYVLVDALGVDVLKRHVDISPLLNRDLAMEITSVFPSTTVAATTSVLTGLPPITTGWLGWCQYVKEVEKSVIFFMNSDYYSKDTVFDKNIASTYCPVEQIYTQIERSNADVKTLEIFPAFREKEHDTFLKQCKKIVSVCHEQGKHFIYTYWDKLDSIMHDVGPGAIEANKMLSTIEKGYEFLINELGEDTIVILIADHGQVDVCPIELRRYHDLWDTFIHEPSIESRATAFFIKQDQKQLFKDLFTHYFRDYFMLLSREEALQMNLFGYGKKHPKTDEFLGDYIAIAIDHYYFKMAEGTYFMKGQHAGLLEKEMIVPLIIHTKK